MLTVEIYHPELEKIKAEILKFKTEIVKDLKEDKKKIESDFEIIKKDAENFIVKIKKELKDADAKVVAEFKKDEKDIEKDIKELDKKIHNFGEQVKKDAEVVVKDIEKNGKFYVGLGALFGINHFAYHSYGFGTSQSGSSYGVSTELGYRSRAYGKSLVVEYRTWFNYSYVYSNPTWYNTKMNNSTYAFGTDLILPILEGSLIKRKIAIYAGLGIGGSSWFVQGASSFGGYKHNTFFQMPVRAGVLVDLNKHLSAQLGMTYDLFRGQVMKDYTINRMFTGSIDVLYSF